MIAGVLIVGSLLWDTENGRSQWRASHLDLDKQTCVNAPIRYGRLSTSRDCTYTMVIDPTCEPGIAKLVPCRNNMASFDDLVTEAEALWKAESPRTEPGVLGSDWGRVAILANPNSADAQQFSDLWKVKLKGRRGHASNDGVLSISWPSTTDGESVALDLMLAVASDPTLHAKTNGLPDPTTIAEAWRRSGERAAVYFWNNRRHGIQTFQDPEIEQLLKG